MRDHPNFTQEKYDVLRRWHFQLPETLEEGLKIPGVSAGLAGLTPFFHPAFDRELVVSPRSSYTTGFQDSLSFVPYLETMDGEDFCKASIPSELELLERLASA